MDELYSRLAQSTPVLYALGGPTAWGRGGGAVEASA